MCLCAFSIMMMTASTIAPMAMAMPPSDMMFELIPCQYMTTNDDQHRNRQNDDGDQRAAEMQEERNAHERDDDAFLDQLFLQRGDRAIN